MNKKKDRERQSLGLVTAALALVIITTWPAEITTEHPFTILSVVCYAATAIAVIVQWIRHFLKYRSSDE